MGFLRFATLTGVDEKTDLQQLAALDDEVAPFAEWGVLLDLDIAGKEARYPTLDWINKFAEFAHEHNIRIALHLCGHVVRDLITHVHQLEQDRWKHTGANRDPARGDLDDLLNLIQTRFATVQLNMRAKPVDVPAILAFAQQVNRSEKRTRTILQWNKANEAVCAVLPLGSSVEIVVDTSGGRGIERSEWPNAKEAGLGERPLGFAGGLGPDNVAKQLPAIAKAASDRPFWVDMETRLRDENDCFSLSHCNRVLEACIAWCREADRERGAVYGAGTQPVMSLSGLWLDFWAGMADDLDMVIPPTDACRAMTFWRGGGKFEGFQPTEYADTAKDLMRKHRIGIMPIEDDLWEGRSADGHVAAEAEDMYVAAMRALVLQRFGPTVPLNPALGTDIP